MIDFNDVDPPPPAERPRYDLDDLTQRLAAGAEGWVPRLFPQGRREGDAWRLADIGGGSPGKHGSCEIALKGEYAGWFTDWETNERGGPLTTLARATRLSGRALYDHAAQMAGITVLPARAPVRESRPGKAEREMSFILSRVVAPAGTPVETYLAGRGLTLPVTSDLLFHPDVTYWDTRTGHPAMVAIVRDGTGRPAAVHRTYLAADSAGKAAVKKPKMMLGPTSGGCVRLADIDANGVLGLAEGIETALSVLQACPHLPVWAALSAGNLERADLPPEGKRLVLLADHDAAGTGRAAAERAARHHQAAGRRVWIAIPPRVGDDFNDMLLKDGAEAVRAAVDGAVEWMPEAPMAPADHGGEHRSVGFPVPGPLPVLRADNGDLADVTDACWRVLLGTNAPPWLFRCGARLSWVERDDDGHPQLVALTEDRVRHILARLVTWLKKAKTGDLVSAYPPAGALKDILATPDPSVPVLAGVVAVPVFGADGRLITVPGYHPSTRLLFEPPAGFTLPPIPANPASTEVAAARQLLIGDLLGDFPFTGDAERAHALALLLLPFVRPMIAGPTPLHLIEKPSPGTGASLMVEAIARITTAAPAAIMVEGRDEEEWRKRLTAKLRQAPTLLLIDNLTRRLDSASIAAAITSTTWEDRILGRSDTARLPVRCAWIATGNNPQVSNEIARRSVRIRLDARIDRPWTRQGFRHDDLGDWVTANRSALVAACLTLVQTWVAAGRPRGGASIGGFEAWAATMGGILSVIGVPGFLANLEEMYEASDAEGTVWRTFVSAWWDRFGAQGVGIADLYPIALACEPPLSLGDGGERSQRTRLGRALARMRDRVFAIPEQQVRLMLAGERSHSQLWTLAPIATGPSPTTPPDNGTGPRDFRDLIQGSPVTEIPSPADNPEENCGPTGLRDFRDFFRASGDNERDARDVRDVIQGSPATGVPSPVEKSEENCGPTGRLKKSLTSPVENPQENCGSTGLRDFRDFSLLSHMRARVRAREGSDKKSRKSRVSLEPAGCLGFFTGRSADRSPVPAGKSRQPAECLERPVGGFDMTAVARQLVAAVTAAGGTVTVEGPNLRLRAPAPLPDELRGALRAHKADVLALLAGPSPEAEPAGTAPQDPLAPWEPGPWSAGIPDDIARGIGRMVVATTGGDFPRRTWRTMVLDTLRLVESGRIVEALTLGWQASDLFGCDPGKPYQRLDRMGLVPLLNGREVASLSTQGAVIHVRPGVTHTFQRRPPEKDAIVLWLLLPAPVQTGPPRNAFPTITTNAGGGAALAGSTATLATVP